MTPAAGGQTRVRRDYRDLCLCDRGAEFMKVDLHVHTPASGDAQTKKRYNLKYDPNDHDRFMARARETAYKIIERCVQEELRLIAVTDHNTPSNVHPERLDLTWYQLLRDAAGRTPEGTTPPVILPGVEISTDDLHVLVILDPDDAPGRDGKESKVDPAVYVIHRVNGLLRDSGFRLEDYGDYRATGMCSLFDVLQQIERLGVGAIAIPAHIDGGNKALTEVYDKRSNVYTRLVTHPSFHAVEVVKADAPDKKRGGFGSGSKKASLREYFEDLRGDRRPIAWLRNSDSHCLEDLGKRHSYVSMGEPGFTGLYNALSDPQTRVRMDEEYDPDPARTMIDGLILREAGSEPVPVRLNPNLNCIIGRKNSHKSTLVDLLIYGLGRFHRDSEEEMKTEESLRSKGYEVTVYVRATDGMLYGSVRKPDGAAPTWWRQSGDGFTKLPKPPENLACPRKYSHEDLSSHLEAPDRAMDFVDRRVFSSSPSLGEAVETRDRLLATCQSKGFAGCAAELRRLRQACDALYKERAKLPDVRAERKTTSDGKLKHIELFLERYAAPAGKPLLMLRVKKGTYNGTRPQAYKDGATLCVLHEGKYKSIQSAPTGIANAAMMCLLMDQRAFGPLVIDEPEQWLDTPGITEILVPQLRRLKERQQVLCVTRDEHVLLSGDAENVIVTEPGRRIGIADSGDMNSGGIQERVLEVFEGSSDGRHLRTKLDKLQGVLLRNR